MNRPDPTTPAHEHNRRAWDTLVRENQRFTRPAPDEDFLDPLRKVDGIGWLGGDIRGQNVLCLASGGGKHGALYAAAGARVTVVDISPAMLELDRRVAEERKLDLQTIEASMDHLPMFADGEFDLVVHPVSTCYVPNVAPVYQEVARVLRDAGLYISQHKQPGSLQADVAPSRRGYELIEPYFRSEPLPPVIGSQHREEGTLEFLHRWDELLGLMCRAGFVIEDLAEPKHARLEAAAGTFGHRSHFVPPYVRVKARRKGSATDGQRRIQLISP
ncbi:MAG TPA: class I SAM-dependent methyltransferase [Pirellulaceae bacterium]|nr:class I SAM-dependent methyltransferase [Pirellulaceae bacterium]